MGGEGGRGEGGGEEGGGEEGGGEEGGRGRVEVHAPSVSCVLSPGCSGM